MSNLILNIRFFYWHLQIGDKFSSIEFTRNQSIKTLKGIKKIQIFNFFNLK
jgi:hypothetical protein